MGFRFRKSLKILPGVRVNFGKKSAGLSIGNKFGGVTMNTRSGVTTRMSAPGTGISYTSKVGEKTKRRPVTRAAAHEGSMDMEKSSQKKPFYKRWWVIALAVLTVIGVVGELGKDDEPASRSEEPAAIESSAPESSEQDGAGLTAVAPVEPSAEPSAATADNAVSATQGKYVGSVDSDKYHDPDGDCRWRKEILPENEIWFTTEEDAKAAGYTFCGTCNK